MLSSIIQYNTIQKVLFHNEGHRPIIQNSHNTVLTKSGKLIVYMWFILLNNMYKDISLNVQLFQREIVIEPNICLSSRKASHRDCSSEYPQHMYQTSSWYCNRSKHMFWSLKKTRLTETVLLSSHNTCKDTLFFWRSDKNIRICFEDVLGCPITIFIFGRLYFCRPKKSLGL